MDAITTIHTDTEQPRRWRDVLPVHPAADLFPLMSEGELRELADDIKKNGLCEPIDIYREWQTETEYTDSVLDGRNRLDALELIGEEYTDHLCVNEDDPEFGFDPYAFVISKNIKRRHLTAEQRRDLIAKVLKAKPQASNREIAKQVKADDKTVAKVRGLQ